MRNPNPLIALVLLLASTMRAAESPAEPGPENAGLRLRLAVAPNPRPAAEGYTVRLDLLNVSDHPIVLRADWRQRADDGDLAAYLESATGIETYPPIEPWLGQVMMAHRTSPQPERTLKPGETLSLTWQTARRQLNNRVSNPLAVQNPTLPTPGLYSVHANLVVQTPDRAVQLRSNEQLVPVGGSRETPKHTFGQLVDVDPTAKTATLSLGSLQKVNKGDQFLVRSAFRDFWTLTITDVQPTLAVGRLTPTSDNAATNHIPKLPDRHTDATLIIPPPVRP